MNTKIQKEKGKEEKEKDHANDKPNNYVITVNNECIINYDLMQLVILVIKQ